MSESTFTDKVALVTGASLGIGRSTALALGRAGAKVMVNYRSHEGQADEVVKAIQDLGGTAVSHQADVSDLDAVQAMVDRCAAELGGLDVAVSNAAYSDRDLFHEADLDGFRRTVDVTMWGAFYLLRTAARQMIQSSTQGAIVLVSSPHAFIPVPRSMAYNMSKAALEHMSKTAAIELSEHGIRVNMIQPGWTDTPGERKFASEETLERAGKGIPLDAWGHPTRWRRRFCFLPTPRTRTSPGPRSWSMVASACRGGRIAVPPHRRSSAIITPWKYQLPQRSSLIWLRKV